MYNGGMECKNNKSRIKRDIKRKYETLRTVYELSASNRMKNFQH